MSLGAGMRAVRVLVDEGGFNLKPLTLYGHEAPLYTDAMLGNNDAESSLPFIAGDEGTPFALIVIPTDSGTAVGAHGHQQAAQDQER